MPKWYNENAEVGTRKAEQAGELRAMFRVPRSHFCVCASYGTKMLPDPLFPSLVAVTSADPVPTARITAVWPNAPSIRATEESFTVHDTARPERMFPLASRRVAKKLALSPAATVSDSGETVTDATGPGLRPGIVSPEESTAAASPSGRPALSCSLQAATASAVAASAAVRTPFMRFLRECVQRLDTQRCWCPVTSVRHQFTVTRGPTFHLHSAFRTPHSALSMPVQAIAWSPSGAVRIVDQRALPEAKIERDLESGEAVADAIRTLQLRGAPLIGIAAAMGLVAGTRELRAASRDRFLARLDELVRLLEATRPTGVNLRWALDRMARVATETPGDWGGSGVWERLQAEATAIWEEDRAMCRRIGEAGLPLIPDGAKVLTQCNAGALATGGIGTALAPLY